VINPGVIIHVGRKSQVMLTENGILRTLTLLEELMIKDPEKCEKGSGSSVGDD
jgi:hypothetical protein